MALDGDEVLSRDLRAKWLGKTIAALKTVCEYHYYGTYTREYGVLRITTCRLCSNCEPDSTS